MINTGKTYKSLSVVLELLNSSYIREGEEIVLRYYEDGTSSIEALVAIGTKTGIGPGCYTILSTSGVQVVTFVSELPDISDLKNGQLYIWTGSPDKKIYKIYLEGTTRVSEPVVSDIFVQDSSGTKYYVNSEAVRKFSDLMSFSDFEAAGRTILLTQEEYEELPESTRTLPGNIFIICSKQ